MADWDYDNDHNGEWPYDRSYDGIWPYDSGHPASVIKKSNMSSAEFERLGNAKVAAEVNRRLDAANRIEREKTIAILNAAKTEIHAQQQSGKPSESFCNWLFGGPAEDVKMIVDFFGERSAQREAKIKLMNTPMPKKIGFNSTTTAISTTGIVR